MFALFFIFIILSLISVEAFLVKSVLKSKVRTDLHFKKENNDGNIGDENVPEKKKGWFRYIPDVIKARFQKSYEIPATDTGNRFHLRLVNPIGRDKRHIITRITRFLPDISYQSAEEVVETALQNGVALVRVLNSKKDAEELLELFKKADPPVRVEIYDAKTDDVILT